jgi:hypothetical protein
MTSKLPKPIALFILLLSFVFSSKAQSIEFKDFQTELKSPHSTTTRLPFEDVRVLDKRFDTSKLGYLFGGSQYKNIILKPSLTSSIEDYFRKNFISSSVSGKVLVVVLKTFWMHEMRLGEEDVEDFNMNCRK